jgi:hypothetical protein
VTNARTRKVPKFVRDRGKDSQERKLSRTTARWIVIALIAVGALVGGIVAASLATGPEDVPEPTDGIVVELPQSVSEVGVPLAEAGCSGVESPTIQGSRIVNPEEKHVAYSSKPPTSGPHYLGPLDPAIYWIPNDPEAVVSNLAVGDVAVWHTGLTPDQQTELKGLFVLLHSEDILATAGDDLELEDEIVLTAWGKLQRCNRLSGEAIADFFQRYRGGGPGI